MSYRSVTAIKTEADLQLAREVRVADQAYRRHATRPAPRRVRALQPFRGEAGRVIEFGDDVAMDAFDAAGAVALGRAEYAD